IPGSGYLPVGVRLLRLRHSSSAVVVVLSVGCETTDDDEDDPRCERPEHELELGHGRRSTPRAGSSDASAPGKNNASCPSSHRTKNGAEPPAPRTSTISPRRSRRPKWTLATTMRSPTTARSIGIPLAVVDYADLRRRTPGSSQGGSDRCPGILRRTAENAGR